MTADRPILAYLEATLKRRLRRHGVVVWYDKDAAFTNVLPALALGEIDLVSWKGSWYDLRYRVEPAFAVLNRNVLASGHGLLVYVPVAQPDKSQDVLLE